MPNNWKTYKLEDISTKLGDGLHGTPKYKADGEYYFINGSNLLNGEIIFKESTKKVDQAQFDKYKKELTERTILVSINGTIGNIAFYNGEKVVLGKSVCYFNIIADVDKFFIKHLLSSYLFQDYINTNYTGSVIKNVSLKTMREFRISLPPLPEQKAIASILSTIDEQIENNLAMNKTLEEMAMALYKHWFVDFGPFQEGNFVESELGEIPEGWEVRPFLELFDLLSGGTPKTKVDEYWNGSIPWVSAKDIGSTNNVFINETEKLVTELGVKKSATKLLPEDTIILVARGSVGKFGMITREMTMNQSCYGVYSKCSYTQPLTFLLISSLISHFLSVAYGSVFDTITTSTFKNINVILPPNHVMKEIKYKIDPLFEQMKHNIIENQTLIAQRDALLPKLVSGEVRVKGFE